ncbi:hypothetical protein Q2941_17520 [Bradyrhizobium sp. UFLA05-153]
MLNLGDPIDVLPTDATRGKLEALRQKTVDTRAIWLPVIDEIRSTRADLYRAQQRHKQLTLARMAGGFGLDDDDPQVADIRRTVTRLEAELARLTSLEQSRGATMHAVGTFLQRCEAWLSGRPGGTTLIESAVIEPAEVMRKNERLRDAAERLRHRLRELDADAHRIRSAPFPSSDCKARMREQIENLAMRGVPDVSMVVEHFGQVGWPRADTVLPLVAMTDGGKPIVGNAQGETTDVLALFCWLHRPALLKAIDSLIDSESDDGHALSQQDRQMKLAEIDRDRFMIERQEAALIWHAQGQGDNLEHRANAHVMAVLGFALETSAA